MNESEWLGRPALAILADKQENRFTTLLCELLRSRRVLSAFLDTCGITPRDGVADLTVRTEVSVPGGRPDLVVRGSSTYLLFEAKVGSWLNQRQVPAYLNAVTAWTRLTPQGLSRLIILAPRRNRNALVEEANRDAGRVGAPAVEGVSWEDIGSCFAALARELPESALRTYLGLFSDLVDSTLGESPVPFTQRDLDVLSDAVVARAYRRLWEVCETLVARLREEDDGTLTFDYACSSGWQGYTIRKGGRWWWIGLWPAIWDQLGATPLVLQTPGLDGHAPKHLSPTLPTTAVFRDKHVDRMLLPLPLVADEHPAQLNDRLLRVVREILSGHPASGGGGRMEKADDSLAGQAPPTGGRA